MVLDRRHYPRGGDNDLVLLGSTALFEAIAVIYGRPFDCKSYFGVMEVGCGHLFGLFVQLLKCRWP